MTYKQAKRVQSRENAKISTCREPCLPAEDCPGNLTPGEILFVFVLGVHACIARMDATPQSAHGMSLFFLCEKRRGSQAIGEKQCCEDGSGDGEQTLDDEDPTPS